MKYAIPYPEDATEVFEATNTRVVGGSIRFLVGNTVNYRITKDVLSIDTTMLDMSVFSKVKQRVVVDSVYEPPESITFGLRIFTDSFTYVSLWSAQTSDPVAGFTIPRKVFRLSQPTEVRFVEVYCEAVGRGHEYLYTSDSVVRISEVDAPVLTSTVNSLPQLSYVDSDLPIVYDIGLNVDQDVAYYVATKPYNRSNDIDGISVKNNMLEINKGAVYNGRAYIIAQNYLPAPDQSLPGLTSAVIIDFNIAETPILQRTNDVKFVMTNTNFTMQIKQLAKSTGRLEWTISPQREDLLISRHGEVIFKKGGAINELVSVSAKNVAGGISNTIQFIMNVSQIPVLTQIPDIRRSIVNNYSFRVRETALDDRLLTWSLQKTSPAISINPFTGVITVQRNNYINDVLTVTATNQAGGSNSHTFSIHVAQAPALAEFPPLLASTSPYGTNTYVIEENPYINLRYGGSPDNSLVVFVGSGDILTVSNPDDNSFLYIRQGTAITKSTTISASIEGTSLSQVLTQNAIGTGPLTWELASPVEGITVDPSGILLTSLEYGFIDQTVNIIVSNDVGDALGREVFQTRFLLAQKPIIQTPPQNAIKVSLDINENYSYQMINTAPGTGTIRWSLSATNPFLEIDEDTGIISLLYSHNTSVYETVTVTATNILNDSTSITFFLNIQHTPVLSPVNSIFTNSLGVLYVVRVMEKQRNCVIDFSPTITNLSAFRDLSWDLSPQSDISILQFDKSTGVLTVFFDNFVERELTLQAYNSAGGVTSLQFIISVAQAVEIVNPGTLIATMTNQDFTYRMRQIALGVGTYEWYKLSTNPAISIDKNTGVLRVLKNSFVDEVLTIYTTSTSANDYRSTTFHVLVAQTPVLTNPGALISVMTQENNFYYDLGRFNFSTLPVNIGTGPITWQITAYQSLIIDNTGLITFEHHNTIDEPYVTVVARNLAGGLSSVIFYMNVSQQIELEDISLITGNMFYRTNFKYSFTKSFVSGSASDWQLTLEPDQTPVPDGVVTISSTGLLTVLYDNFVNHLYTLSVIQQVINSDGVEEEVTVTRTFTLRVAQNPIVAFPFFQKLINLEAGSPGSFSAGSYQKAIGTGDLTWDISPRQTGITMNRTTGTISIAANTPYINTVFTISATNITRGSSQPTLPMIIATRPVMANVSTVSYSIDSDGDFTTDPLTVTTSPLLTGPLVWTMAETIEGLIFNSNGSFTVLEGYYVENRQVTVTVSNLAGGSDSKVLTLNLVRRPILRAPPNNMLSIPFSRTTTYTYAVEQLRVPIGTLEWSISPNNHPGLSINETTGVISLLASSQIQRNVTITVRDKAQGSPQPLVVYMQKIKEPLLAPVTDKIFTMTTQPLQFQVVETNGTTGALRWNTTDAPGLSINSNGFVTFALNNFINRQVTVIATNALNQSSSVTFFMRVAQQPQISNNPDTPIVATNP